jgi:hypothetical protein
MGSRRHHPRPRPPPTRRTHPPTPLRHLRRRPPRRRTPRTHHRPTRPRPRPRNLHHPTATPTRAPTATTPLPPPRHLLTDETGTTPHNIKTTHGNRRGHRSPRATLGRSGEGETIHTRDPRPGRGAVVGRDQGASGPRRANWVPSGSTTTTVPLGPSTRPANAVWLPA